MKVLKSAKQKSVMVCRSYYNDYDVEEMLRNKEIFYFNREYEVSYDITMSIFENEYRILTDDIDKMVVEYDKVFAIYVTVAYLKNGVRIVLNML